MWLHLRLDEIWISANRKYLDVIYILSILRRRLRAEGKVWVHKEPGWTSAKKVTGKVALSKHSCRTCVHICVFVNTHGLSVIASSPWGIRARALINPKPPLSLSPEPASLSTHYFSNPWAVIKDKDAFYILSPLFCCCFHPSIHWPPCSLVSQCQEQRLGDIPVVFASCMENSLEPVLSNSVQSLLTLLTLPLWALLTEEFAILENTFIQVLA